METKMKDKVQWALETFNNNGIEATLEKDFIMISNYCQPKGTTFEALGINEDELIENVGVCLGCFDFLKSKLTTFPLIAAKEIRMYKDTKVKEMPNLKIAGSIIVSGELKKVPKLKRAISISLDGSLVKAFPKLKEVDILIAQNSALEKLDSLEASRKLCLIDCPIKDLSELKNVEDLFICSSDEENKIELKELKSLQSAKNVFIANCLIKALPNLKNVEKIGLFNTEIKSIKKSIKAQIEISNKISDEDLSNKFDSFTDWYNSDILNKSMDLLGEVVKQIKK